MRSKLFTVLALVAVSAGFSIAPAEEGPELVGRWSAPFWEGGTEAYDPPSKEKSKLYPSAAALTVLPDGRLLYWNVLENSEEGQLWVSKSDGTVSLENSRTRILDLTNGQPVWSIPNLERGTTDQAHDGTYATKDLFCSDQKLLYDGTLLIAGGSEWRIDQVNDPLGSDVYGDDEARIFEPSTDTFRSVGQMHEPRWYPALTTLPDGRVLATSGLRRLIGSFANPEPSFSQVRLSEIYDPVTETWQEAGTSEWSLPLYPRLHVLPDGKVYFGGSGQMWGQFGETADELTWAVQRSYDPATRTWTMLDPARYGARSGATSTLLRLQPPYDSADILLAGGTLGSSPGTLLATTLSDVIRWSSSGISAVGDQKAPLAGLAGDQTQLRSGRWFGTSVMLPTGEVLLVNGGDTDDVLDPGSAAGVRTADLYDPVTGTWRALAMGSRDRIYHNTAVLLPDGRILVGGHVPHPAHQTTYDNPIVRANNYRDSTFEIYEPPYLFRGPRPVIESYSFSGDARSVTIDATDADEVVLVRLGAITHAQDSDMRAVVLEHTVNPDGTVTASLPRGGDGRIVPPGPYYLFVNSIGAEGSVPSVAQTVLVQPDQTGEVRFAPVS